jgi:competence protein ComEA
MFPLTTVRNMPLVFRSSIKKASKMRRALASGAGAFACEPIVSRQSVGRIICYLFILPAFSTTMLAQKLPDGPGRAELEKMCKQCHELARSVSLRQDRDGWDQTMTKMAAFGMKSSDQDYALVRDYLAKYFPAEDIPRINVNKASAIELESGLSLKRSQAAAVLLWRAEHGSFKSLEDLKKVPLMDAGKIEAKKDRITF